MANNTDILLNWLDLPNISQALSATAEIDFTIEDLYESLSSMQGGKSPGKGILYIVL